MQNWICCYEYQDKDNDYFDVHHDSNLIFLIYIYLRLGRFIYFSFKARRIYIKIRVFRDKLFRLVIGNIYTPSVFCYDKHKKNFDIQFSMKRHETV